MYNLICAFVDFIYRRICKNGGNDCNYDLEDSVCNQGWVFTFQGYCVSMFTLCSNVTDSIFVLIWVFSPSCWSSHLQCV